ncbi:MAG: hypothetical protein JW870_05905 [Candidatus Delongbacteria bacterium]|nr:hypothetical protein [Candidatus Delongbacteria bacterium]
MKQIFFFLTLILIVSACTIDKLSTDNPDITEPNNNDDRLIDCNKLPLIQEGLAISYPRYSCYIDVAIEEKDVQVCEYIEDDFKYECYQQVAMSIGDLSTCDKLLSQLHIEVCYKGVAITNSDESVCEKISDETTEDNCYLGVSRSSTELELCEKMNSKAAFYAECKKNIAVNNNDESICENIGWEKFKDECFLELGVCSKITDPDLSQKCLSKEVDLSDCESADSFDKCVFTKATNVLNSNVCSRIANTALKYECYRDIAVDTQDSSICENMQLGNSVTESAVERSISRCNEDVASGTKDSTFY